MWTTAANSEEATVVITPAEQIESI